jgi:hypothetical protein
MAKASFDGIAKIISITESPVDGYVDIDVKIDIYSDWKEWCLLSDNIKYEQALYAVGGDPLPGEKALGTTYFLLNGWKIRPYEGNHTLNINGNLYAEDGSSPYVQTLATYNVMVINSVSSLVDSTVQQLKEIEYASFNDGVTIDVINGIPGTEYPIGTSETPVDNIEDAVTIAAYRGFKNLKFIGNFTFESGVMISNYNLIGEGMQKSVFTFENGCIVAFCKAFEAKLTGQVLGIVGFENCHLIDYSSSGLVPSSRDVVVKNCLVEGDLALPDNYTGNLIVLDCWSGSVATLPPSLDMNGAQSNVIIRNYSGGIEIKNYTQPYKLTIDLNVGRVILDSSVTGGNITIRGTGTLVDNSVGASVNSDGLINRDNIATSVWDEEVSARTTVGSMGNAMRFIPKFTSNPWWVSPSGNNSNSGTSPEDAFLTINYAISQASSGDVITIADGTYAEAVDVNKVGIELRGEIGSIITGNGSTPVTVSANYVILNNLIASPVVGQTGFLLSGISVVSVNDCTSSGGSIGFATTGSGYSNRLSRCTAAAYFTTGFSIGTPSSFLDECVAAGIGLPSRGFYLSNTNADGCVIKGGKSINNGLYGFDVISGANNNIFENCISNTAKNDSGTNNQWFGYNGEASVWDQIIADHTETGTTGDTLNKAKQAAEDAQALIFAK